MYRDKKVNEWPTRTGEGRIDCDYSWGRHFILTLRNALRVDCGDDWTTLAKIIKHTE